MAGYRLWYRVQSKLFSLLSSRAFASFGRRSVIQPPIRLSGERRISIGADVFVGAGCWLQVLKEREDGVALEIGDGTSLAGNCVISVAKSVSIGRKVLIARGAYIADHGHAYDDARVPVMDQGITKVNRVEIADGAWLGENVVVGPGVRIGRGAVIGANAVVLRDIADYSVAVGIPARVIRASSDS